MRSAATFLRSRPHDWLCSFLTYQRLNGGHLAQVLQELVDGVVVLWGNGVLMIQQELTREQSQDKSDFLFKSWMVLAMWGSRIEPGSLDFQLSDVKCLKLLFQQKNNHNLYSNLRPGAYRFFCILFTHKHKNTIVFSYNAN